MIKSITTGALIVAALYGHAQVHPNDYLWYNNGAGVFVGANCLLTIQGDMTNNQNNATGITHFTNNGFVWAQGNLYGDHAFKQAGTGTIRLQNNTNLYTAPYANENYQIISGGYQVHGGQSAIDGSNDGSFYNLELDNSTGSVFIIDTADVRGSVNFQPQAVTVDGIGIAPNGNKNTLRTYNPGTGATPANAPANGDDYNGVFGIMNITTGITGGFLNCSTNLMANTTTADSNYIQGKLRRAIDAVNGGSYGFPIGLETSTGGSNARGIQYAALDFTGANNYDVVTAYFQKGQSNTIDSLDSVCNAHSNFAYYGTTHGQWIFSALNNSPDPYTITIYPQDFGATVSDVYFITSTNATNDVYAPEDQDCGSSPLGIHANNILGMQSFGFAGGSATYPLTLSLLHFEGNTNGCNALLSWKTTKNTFTNFDVMYSDDGKMFRKISAVGGINETSFHFDYRQPNRIGYYQLNMMDAYNIISQSAIIRLEVDCKDAEVSLYPNPTNNILNISHLKEGKKTISILTTPGTILYSFITDAIKTYVDMSSYTAGLYTIRIENENGAVTSHKIITLSK